MSVNPSRDAKRERRRADHRCLDCGGKLADDYTKFTCEHCLVRKAEHYRASVRTPRPHGTAARILATAGTMTSKQQAAVFGRSVSYVRQIRCAARSEGIPVPTERRGGGPESGRWAQLDASERCPVCRLLLPHDGGCLRGDPTDRRGPGRVYPEGAA